ncbi:AAA family ATPase [Acinetobacter baumannii]|uniref:AAA family ATPase n=1 Tax=Acinetobacter baumannii TaxID=470 RepID=UPI00244D264B|nr:AAA family ATPase [Acinetobacter baumannii]MDH2522089.1 AAA family ATPase [Acinetobacter baumannii]
MLKQISIENFKAFADLQEIDLAPITLIYGANSSGKSSIIHSLMVLKQSILFPNLKGGVYSDKRILDVGSYSTMVYSHQNSRDIAFGLRFADKMSNKFDLQEKLFAKFVYTYVDTEKNKNR